MSERQIYFTSSGEYEQWAPTYGFSSSDVMRDFRLTQLALNGESDNDEEMTLTLFESLPRFVPTLNLGVHKPAPERCCHNPCRGGGYSIYWVPEGSDWARNWRTFGTVPDWAKEEHAAGLARIGQLLEGAS